MRKILITIPTLNSGGVEVSLVRFINELSRDKDNKITLLMLKREGLYLDSIPDSVEIIEVSYDDRMYSYNNKFSDIKNIKGISRKIKFFNYRMKLKNKLARNDWEGYYKIILEHVNNISSEYDIAIDWHGYGHFVSALTASCVNAKKRAMWIHDEKNEWLSKVDCWLDCYDKIFCVGKACLNNALGNSEKLKDKLEVFYNMTDYLNVRKKADAKMDFKYDSDKLNIVTVGRLEWQKAYDVAIETAEILKSRNVNFCWYAIGGGSLEEELKNMVLEKKLEDNFKFLGIVSNPFPYVKNASLYVLSSRHEGYCLATLEAKILGSVIIATDIDKQVLEKAKVGLYNEKSIESVPDDLKCKYFTQVGKSYKISDEIKKHVEFREHNLLRDPYPSGCHLIVCRNVVIYFTEEAKDEIYRKFYDSLAKDGMLFIGSTEQIMNYRELNLKRHQSFFFQK